MPVCCLSPRGFSTPAPHHRCRAALESGGSGLQVEEVILPDGEEHKSIEVLQQVRFPACLSHTLSTPMHPAPQEGRAWVTTSPNCHGQVWDKALQARLDRNSTFLALGGGVIGDMTGFAAAAYQRGVHFIQASLFWPLPFCITAMLWHQAVHALGLCYISQACSRLLCACMCGPKPWKLRQKPSRSLQAHMCAVHQPALLYCC